MKQSSLIPLDVEKESQILSMFLLLTSLTGALFHFIL